MQSDSVAACVREGLVVETAGLPRRPRFRPVTLESPPAPAEGKYAYDRKAVRGPKAAGRLLAENERLCLWYVKRQYRRGRILPGDWDEAYALALEGLWVACRRWDPARKVKFGYYATWWMRHGLSRYHQKKERAYREQEALGLCSLDTPTTLDGVPLKDLVAAGYGPGSPVREEPTFLRGGDGSGDGCGSRQGPKTWAGDEAPQFSPENPPDGPERGVHAFLKLLGPATCRLLRQHFWEGLSYGQIAQRLGVSKQRVGMRVRQAVEELRVEMERAGLARADIEDLLLG